MGGSAGGCGQAPKPGVFFESGEKAADLHSQQAAQRLVLGTREPRDQSKTCLHQAGI